MTDPRPETGSVGAHEGSFLRDQQQILEATATGVALPSLLERIVQLIEAQAPNMLCSILLLDRAAGVLRHGATSSLPARWVAFVDGTPIGEHVGSCGAAAALAEVVEVDDIATHPNWAAFRDEALELGLRACWSAPILSPDREVLGTFAMYYPEARGPSAAERRWVEAATHLAAIAIASHRTRQIEAALVQSEAELRAIFQNAGIGIAVVEQDGSIVRVNAAFCRMLGYSEAELVGANIKGLADPDELPQALSRGSELLAGRRGDYQTDRRFRKKGGDTLSTRVTVSRIELEGGRVLALGMVEDVTDKKRLEAQLLRSHRLDGLSRLAGGLAHDFNNVLTAIQGSAQQARADLRDDHPVQRALTDIELATQRAAELVGRILAFSTDAEPRRTLQPIGPLVHEVVRVVMSKLPERVTLRQRVDDAPILVQTHATQVQQLVMNLVTNAFQAMPEGGVVEIALARRAAADGVPPGSWVVLSVCDEGAGIAPEIREHIFEPFFTTRAIGQGTGLGLTVVQSIARGHDGRVLVRPNTPRGTCFEVWLPTTPAVEAPAPVAHPSAIAAPSGGGALVLFVDDEPVIGRLARRELEGAGFRVSAHDDPVRALEAFHAAPDTFAAIVTDASMPRLSGFDVAREVRKLRPTVPIVVISGGLWNRDSGELESLGIAELLLKPQALRELAQTLRRLLADA